MNRFGDDLTEEVLQYLRFEDKVRLECVSKQWRRLVFDKQFCLKILVLNPIYANYEEWFYLDFKNESNCGFDSLNTVLKDRQLNTEAFVSVLKKCPNIKKVIFGILISSKHLSIISKFCPRIKSLGFRRRYNQSWNKTFDERFLEFFRENGNKFEDISVVQRDEAFNEYLKYCPNLKNLNVNDDSWISNNDKDFLPKLQRIESRIALKDKESHLMKSLTDKYSQTMKTLNVDFSFVSEEVLKTCIGYISRFENLTQLRLEFCGNKNEELLNSCLLPIGQNHCCSQLLPLC